MPLNRLLRALIALLLAVVPLAGVGCGPNAPQAAATGLGGEADAEATSQTEQSNTSPIEGKNSQPPAHPLDPVIAEARELLAEMQQNVVDYTAVMVKRERIDDELQEHQFISLKVRNRRTEGDELKTPLSAYLRFLKPDWIKGREVIWVEGQNDGKLIAHETGFANLFQIKLDPEGFVAMIGQRYPITNIGIENLLSELIKRGERDRKYPECEVNYYKDSKIDERLCRMIEVIHPEPSEHFDFYKARICIDNELKVPIYYAAWTWPEEPGGDPVLQEEYTYRDIKLNVGLTDKDFDPDNPDYDYP